MNRLIALLLVLFLSFESFGAQVSDNDGAAFITKAEFDSMKSSFQDAINEFNTSMDAKIESAISSYIAGLSSTKEKTLPSLLNKLTETRRTFINSFSNPTTSKQENLYISTDGFWAVCYDVANGGTGSGFIDTTGAEPRANNWFGWQFNGINNYGADPNMGGAVHHIRGPKELNNLTDGTKKGNGKYVFIKPVFENNVTGYYITDEYLKDLKYTIWSYGIDDVYPTPKIYRTSPTYKEIDSIDWTNTYNWTGVNVREVGTYKGADNTTTYTASVNAAETLFLGVENYAKMSWVDYMPSGAMWTANTGCVTEDDQYNWTNHVTNFSLGTSGPQTYGASFKVVYTNAATKAYRFTNIVESDSYLNRWAASKQIKLNFYTPKITDLPGTRLAVKDASDVTSTMNYYYNGLPLCLVDKEGAMEIKLTLKGGRNADISFAISRGPFPNSTFSSTTEGVVLYKTVPYSDWTGDKEITLTIPKSALSGIKDEYLYIKAYQADQGSTKGTATVATTNIKITQSS